MDRISPAIKAFFPAARFKNIKNFVEFYGVKKLPAPYQKFYDEWTDEENATAIHWVPRSEEWERDPETGQVQQVQNCPIPVLYPTESHQMLWGGEGVVFGHVKKKKFARSVPRFWMPSLQENVVFSEILDKYLSVICTERALTLIDHHCGLDYYLLQTPANDLKANLPIKLKRRMYLALLDKDFAHTDEVKQEEIYNKYKQYMIPREEAEWYGLTYHEAVAKWDAIQKMQHISSVVPLKHQYRLEFLKELENQKNNPEEQPSEQKRWIAKLNPFSKPKHAPSSPQS